ncbi:uncharacterized protein ColSpa_08863 [Colletotrichum spaethianum]|uniref:DUF7053 domain-containing protein n=1 Tax=Colletotrichum spaethianum TaxID=700344 RepID=A0AA37PAJ4_9PEZI|nr:uncharacterized protein ColSpa_08863 [Colletotrichum spaethianum]GKT48682.1 hypothetical protein ColSpa_08863 [Colletotrichum spaethianum]
MSKRSTFTTISPLPAGITREAVLGFLHNHLEMIDLNPLIKERHLIPAPSHAPPEEHACAWYSLTDEISYLPGGMATGDVSYTCCFHNLPTGLQTHCYAPMGLEIRDKWTVAGCLPGEPVEPVELGIGAPLTGLYIREDVDMRCNVFTSSFVKKTLKKSHGLLVDRIKSKVQQASAAAAHQRHSSQASQSGSDANGASNTPAHQSHQSQAYSNLAANQTSLPYRPSYPMSPPAPACDGAQSAAYPEPLRIRHTSANSTSSLRLSRPDSRSQPGDSSSNNYTHGNYSDLGGNPYGTKPPPSSPYTGNVSGGDAHQRAAGQHQSSGGALQGPFVAELE